MIRKSILVTALLLLATVQTLAANCDLRCSLMAVSSGGHDCGHGQMAQNHHQTMHCHGMSMDAGNPCNSVLGESNCGVTICRTRLDLINKNASPDGLTARSVPVTYSVPLLNSVDQSSWTRFPAHRSPDRQDASAPLELRPGSSLRI